MSPEEFLQNADEKTVEGLTHMLEAADSLFPPHERIYILGELLIYARLKAVHLRNTSARPMFEVQPAETLVNVIEEKLTAVSNELEEALLEDEDTVSF